MSEINGTPRIRQTGAPAPGLTTGVSGERATTGDLSALPVDQPKMATPDPLAGSLGLSTGIDLTDLPTLDDLGEDALLSPAHLARFGEAALGQGLDGVERGADGSISFSGAALERLVPQTGTEADAHSLATLGIVGVRYTPAA